MAESRNEIPDIYANIPGMYAMLIVPQNLNHDVLAAWYELCSTNDGANTISFNASTVS
jgi:hypothetical protein